MAVPVRPLEHIAEDYNKDLLMLIGFDKRKDEICFTSYGRTATDKLEAARAINLIKIHYFGVDIPDGEEAPIGFEQFAWSNEDRDFILKENLE